MTCLQRPASQQEKIVHLILHRISNLFRLLFRTFTGSTANEKKNTAEDGERNEQMLMCFDKRNDDWEWIMCVRYTDNSSSRSWIKSAKKKINCERSVRPINTVVREKCGRKKGNREKKTQFQKHNWNAINDFRVKRKLAERWTVSKDTEVI